MKTRSRTRGLVKFVFWAAVAATLVTVIFRSYYSGQMARWYYHTASSDGYAVNADSFKDATKENPAVLQVATASSIDGLTAVPVKKGDRLPAHANGVIEKKIIEDGKRAVLEGDQLKIRIPSEIKEKSGFKYNDTFKHKKVKTYPWSAVWNVAMTLVLGLALGFMAEGLTDVMGLKLEKIRHFEGH